MVSRKNATVINCAQSRVLIDFSYTVSKIQNIGHSDILAHGKSYEHDFVKKTRWSYTLREVTRRVKFQSIFRAPSRKLKILAIPDVLDHWNSYEHGFTKKCDDHKICSKSRTESSFDLFFMHHLENLKYWPFPTY
ncbi:hypothetical protein BHE74_00047500 [Ensete ventricosum]|nr:hypothetical protein BHE74_00047500 [Ensete ventricosum]